MKTPYDIIIKPIISEMSMDEAHKKKYTFQVARGSNRTQVKAAIEEKQQKTKAAIDNYVNK